MTEEFVVTKEIKKEWRDQIKREQTPILAKGHTKPTKPVYWAVQLLDEHTKKSVAVRMTWSKYVLPREASQECFGMPPSPNMRFYNLTSRIADARKMIGKIG